MVPELFQFVDGADASTGSVETGASVMVCRLSGLPRVTRMLASTVRVLVAFDGRPRPRVLSRAVFWASSERARSSVRDGLSRGSLVFGWSSFRATASSCSRFGCEAFAAAAYSS